MSVPPYPPDEAAVRRPSLTRGAAGGLPPRDSILNALQAEHRPARAGALASRRLPQGAWWGVAALPVLLAAGWWGLAAGPTASLLAPVAVERPRALAVGDQRAGVGAAVVGMGPVVVGAGAAPDAGAPADAAASAGAAAGAGAVAIAPARLETLPDVGERVTATAAVPQPRPQAAGADGKGTSRGADADAPRPARAAARGEPAPQRSARASAASASAGGAATVASRSGSLPARVPPARGGDPDVELVTALMSHVNGERGGAAGAAMPGDASAGASDGPREVPGGAASAKPVQRDASTIAGLVAACRERPKPEADACRRRICSGYWGKAQACPARKSAKGGGSAGRPEGPGSA